MKFIPRDDYMIGRLVVRKPDSLILRVDKKKQSKFLLVDAVGVKAAEEGFKVGDIVVPVALSQIVLDGAFRPMASCDKIAFMLTDYDKDTFEIQTETGEDYVPFDSEDAAKSFGESA